MEFLWGRISNHQKLDDNICLLAPMNTVAGGIFIQRDYWIDSGILVPVYNDDNIYGVEARWYKAKEKLYLYGEADLTGNCFETIDVGDKISITKVKFKYRNLSGDSGIYLSPDIISAYIECRNGISGWISMDYNDHYDIIIDNRRSFMPM